VVSHYLQLIESLEPDAVMRLDRGCIAEHGDLSLAREIARTGFARASEPVEV
jgi:Fe-S cluster assembly ATP-binding protein